MVAYLLEDPGFVRNSPDGERCVHACVQMCFRTRSGTSVPSFDDIDILVRQKENMYTWEYGALLRLAHEGFSIRIKQMLDLGELASRPVDYLKEHFGSEIGGLTAQKTDTKHLQHSISDLLKTANVRVDVDIPTLDDLRQLIDQGYFLLLTVNQRVLQADPGYIPHVIFGFGHSTDGLFVHNPGPPALAHTLIDWTLLEKAWSSPDANARILIAVRP